MKAILCSALPLIFFANAIAKSPSEFDLLFLRNHIAAGFDIPFLITKRGGHEGAGDLRLRQLPGFALKVEYAYNFNRYFGITSGAKMGLQVFGYDVHAGADDFDMTSDLSRKYSQVIPFFSIPLMLAPRIFISGKNMLQADIGGSIVFIAPGNSTSTLSYRDGADTKQVFEMRVRLEDSPQFTFHAGLSYGVVLKCGNILKAGLAYDLGKRKMMNGDYTFLGNDVVVGTGNIYSTLSFYAFEFSYVFTRYSALQRH